MGPIRSISRAGGRFVRPATIAFLGAVVLAISACGGSKPVAISHTPIPTATAATGSFDVVEIDQAAHRLYVADRTNKGVDVFYISTAQPKYVMTIPVPSSPNGLALAPDIGRLFVGTAIGSVAIIDVKPGSPTHDHVIGEIPTGAKKADLLDYGADRQRLYVSSSTEGKITSIDPATGTVKAHFTIGYAVEQPRYDPVDGMVYVTSPDANALFKVDPNNGSVTKIPLGGSCQPTGMAINPKTNTAVIACSSFIVSWDLAHATAQTFTQVAGGDIVSYDAKADRFLVASPNSTVVGLFGGNPVDYVASVPTGSHGNSAAYDETNDMVYTPDSRPNTVGIASFRPPATTPSWESSLLTIGPFAVALAALVILMFVAVGRNADPIRRKALALEPRVKRPLH
jgi:hypothetical protein